MSSHRHRQVAAVAARALVAPVLVPLALVALTAGDTDLGAQELRYSLTPTAQWVQWDDDLAIDDTYLWGGRAGFTFGEYIELQGFYLTRGRVDRELGVDIGLPASSDSPLDISNYGADLVINLSPTQLKPFIRAGGSILRFEPEGGEDTRQVALRYGGGFRFGNAGQLRLQIYAEDLVFRVDRGRLAGLPVGADPEADELRHNIVYGAGLTIPLGGATSGDDSPAFSLTNFSLPIELFGGVLNFDDELDFEGQNLVGVRTGLNFGPLVSVRGYYWRGVDDDFSRAVGIESWGGEGQFRLNVGPGLNPYLVAGAGQLNFREGFTPETEITPDDRIMLILGGGIGLELTERVRLDLSARNHLFNAEGEIEDVERADDLRSNWLLSAGLGFNIGGSTADERPRPRPPVVARVDTVVVDRETGEVVRRARGAERGVAERDRRDTARVAERDTVRVVEVDTVRVARELRPDSVRRVVADTAMQGRAAGYAGERMIQLPVPTEGELYVRYGPAGDSVRRMAPGTAAMPDEDEVTRQAVREILREELTRASGARDTAILSSPERRELLERRLLDRVDSAVAARARPARVGVTGLAPTPADEERERQRLLEDIDRAVRAAVQSELERREALRPQPARPLVTPPPQAPPVVTAPAQPQRVFPRSFSVYTGLNANEGAQFVIGGRANVGPITRNLPRIALVPEFALGLGDGTTALVAANGQYRFDPFDINNFGILGLYAQLGLGFYMGTLDGDNEFDLTLNPGYGVEFTLDDVRRMTGTSQLFAEHQGIDFFKRNRFVVGLRWPY